MISNIFCQSCLFSFESINYLFIHLQELSPTCQLHKNALFNCPICVLECQGGDEFCRHLSRDHFINACRFEADVIDTVILKGQRKCSYCEKVFRKPSDLERHIRTHTNEKPFICLECGRRFKIKSTLDSHKRTHLTCQEDLYTCIFCNRNFLSFSALKLHMRIHTNETPFPCDVSDCTQSFRTRKLMQTHVRNFHKNNIRCGNSHVKKLHLQSLQNVKGTAQTITAPCAVKNAVLNSMSEISRLERQQLITSQNTAFSEFRRTTTTTAVGGNVNDNNGGADIRPDLFRSTLVVIRMQVRSGSVVAGVPSAGPIEDIIIQLPTLLHISQHERFKSVALCRTSLPLDLSLSIDSQSVLNRLKPHQLSPQRMLFNILDTTSNSTNSISSIAFSSTASDYSGRVFTTVVYPTVQHVVSLPFSVLCTEDDLRKIRCHMPSFLIECFLTANYVNQYEIEHRQILAQSCLPMLCNEDGIQVWRADYGQGRRRRSIPPIQHSESQRHENKLCTE